jgi:hypothetical protein
MSGTIRENRKIKIDLTGDFDGWWAEMRLHVPFNRLRELPQALSSLTNLVSINVQGNLLESVEPVAGMRSLREA